MDLINNINVNENIKKYINTIFDWLLILILFLLIKYLYKKLLIKNMIIMKMILMNYSLII